MFKEFGMILGLAWISGVHASPVTVTQTKSAAETADAISTVMKAENNHTFTGSPVTLKLNAADVHDVLRMIGEASGFNIVIHPAVQGKLTLSLEQVPWDQALDVVLTTLKLGAERTNSVLRVMPREMLIAEKQDEINAKKVSAATTPRITRVFPVSYADLSQLSTLLQSFATAQSATPGESGVPTTIIVDQNTQSLIVRDSAENVERIRKMIELLDVQTPQVLIETKVVSATEGFNKTLNGNFAAGGSSVGFAFNGPQAALAGTTLGLPDATKGFGTATNLTFGLFQRTNISAALNLAESENKAKVITSPRTVVLSGKSSTVSQQSTQGVLLITPATNQTLATQSITTIAATTSLTVTPKVTNDGSIFMKLDLKRDVINLSNKDAPVVEPRTINTEVIVESGGTLVIGGISNMDKTDSETGIPFLRKIPLIGWLFGGETHLNSKSELMFFVSPRILNQKKAGITTDTAQAGDAPAKL